MPETKKVAFLIAPEGTEPRVADASGPLSVSRAAHAAPFSVSDRRMAATGSCAPAARISLTEPAGSVVTDRTLPEESASR